MLWACLLGGWLGFVFACGVCSLVVFAFLGVGARLGVVGQCGPAAPRYARCLLAGGVLVFALLVFALLVWALLACAGLARARAGGRMVVR